MAAFGGWVDSTGLHFTVDSGSFVQVISCTQFMTCHSFNPCRPFDCALLMEFSCWMYAERISCFIDTSSTPRLGPRYPRKPHPIERGGAEA